MKIKSIEIEGLHGYLNKKINFYEDENYLVGINGCGKSSILKILDSFIKGNFDYLKRIQFHRLFIETNKNDYEMEKTIDSEGQRIIIIDRNLNNTKFIENKRELERLTLITNKDIETKEKIKELRASLGNEFYYLEDMFEILNTIPQNYFSLGLEVEGLEEKLVELNKINKDEIEDPLERFMNNIVPIREIEKILKKEGDNHLKKISFKVAVENIEKEIEKEIEKSKELETQHNKFEEGSNKFNEMEYNLLINYKENLEEFNQELIKYNEKINILKKKLKDLQKRKEEINYNIDINKYINIMNKFLKDSFKKLKFDIVDGEFSIELLENKINNRIKNLRYLASGEKQLLILFTKIYFHMKKDSIILIDEPETSLHIKWQKIFIESLKEAIGSNYNPQIIVATHSPFIVDKVDRNKIISVYPYNREDDGDE